MSGQEESRAEGQTHLPGQIARALLLYTWADHSYLSLRRCGREVLSVLHTPYSVFCFIHGSKSCPQSCHGYQSLVYHELGFCGMKKVDRHPLPRNPGHTEFIRSPYLGYSKNSMRRHGFSANEEHWSSLPCWLHRGRECISRGDMEALM